MSVVLVFGMLGGWEVLLILLAALLLFGRRLPEVGRSLGRGLVEFKKGVKGISDEIEDTTRVIKDETNRLDDEKKNT